MTSNRPVSEMVERVRDVFASYDLDDFNRWSDRGVERFTREIIEAASSQAPSDAQARNLTRMQDGRIMTDEEIARAAIPPKPAIPSAVASDADVERWKGETYLDLSERRNPGADEFAKGFNYGIIEARNLIYARLPNLLAAIPSAGGIEELREALKSICREAGKGGERNMASIFSRDKRRITYIPDGLIDWQRCVDRIQNIARAALESTGK